MSSFISLVVGLAPEDGVKAYTANKIHHDEGAKTESIIGSNTPSPNFGNRYSRFLVDEA